MAADSAMSAFKMIDLENFMKGNVGEAIKNTLAGTCAYERVNVVGNRLLTKSTCKLYVMKNNNIAIADGNQRNFGSKNTVPYIHYFCNNHVFNSPKSCAEGLLNFILGIDKNIDAVFYVCGYNFEDTIPRPEFYCVEVKDKNIIDGVAGMGYGISFHSANEYFSRYVTPISKNMASYSLQDAVDVTLFAIDMSIKLERFIDREEFISPPIDLLVIEPTGVKWIKHKTLKADG